MRVLCFVVSVATSLLVAGCERSEAPTRAADEPTSIAKPVDAPLVCDGGRIDVGGVCCFEGQRVEGDACAGTPSKCPAPLLPDPVASSCTPCAGSGTCQRALDACGDDPNACMAVGLKFAQESRGLIDDVMRATSIFERACELGNARACNNLGVHYERGFGVERDEGRAVELYEQACDDPSKIGCVNFASVLERTGKPARAGQIFEGECERGVVVACHRLALSIEAVEQARAAELYEGACGASHMPACSRFAEVLRRRGDVEDARRAVRYDKAACKAGEAMSCRELGVAYELGRGAPKDEAIARGFYKTACDRSDPNGCARLGVFVARGIGGARDEVQAIKLLAVACQYEEMLGCTTLGAMASYQPLASKAAEALYGTFERDCEQGKASACAMQGDLLIRGIGAARDLERGPALLEKACAGGDVKACQHRHRKK